MSDRRCGYCRGYDHRANTCQVKSNQKLAIAHHLYKEKKAVHDILLRNGLGIGALVRSPNGGSVGVIRSLKESFHAWNNNFVEYRPIKYAKTVRSNLKSYSGIAHHGSMPIDNTFVRYETMSHLYIVYNPLDSLNHTEYGIVALALLPNPPLDNPYIQNNGPDYFTNRSMEILSPSDETDLDDSFFMEPHILHTRLEKDKRGYGVKIEPITSLPA